MKEHSGCVPELEVGDSVSVSLLSRHSGESKRFLSSDISVFLCSSRLCICLFLADGKN